MFHIPWIPLVFSVYFFKNEDLSVKIFIFIIPILRTNNFQGEIFVYPSYSIPFLVHVLSGSFCN